MFTHSGMGGMELVACYLKSQGALLSRTLSYEGARFELVEAELGNDHVESYNQSAVLWQVNQFKHLLGECFSSPIFVLNFNLTNFQCYLI